MCLQLFWKNRKGIKKKSDIIIHCKLCLCPPDELEVRYLRLISTVFVSISTDEYLKREADFRCEASVVKYVVKGILNINWADKEEKNISCH